MFNTHFYFIILFIMLYSIESNCFNNIFYKIRYGVNWKNIYATISPLLY